MREKTIGEKMLKLANEITVNGKKPFMFKLRKQSLEGLWKTPKLILCNDAKRKEFFVCDNDLVDREDLTLYEKMAYIVLRRYAGSSSECFPTYDTIASKSGMCRRQAIKIIQSLIKKKCIAKESIYLKSNLYKVYSVKLSNINSKKKLILCNDAKRTEFFVCDNDLVDREDLTLYEKMVYIVLRKYAGSSSECFPSYNIIAAKSGMCRSQAIRVVKSLIKKKCIAKESIYLKSNLYKVYSIKKPKHLKNKIINAVKYYTTLITNNNEKIKNVRSSNTSRPNTNTQENSHINTTIHKLSNCNTNFTIQHNTKSNTKYNKNNLNYFIKKYYNSNKNINYKLGSIKQKKLSNNSPNGVHNSPNVHNSPSVHNSPNGGENAHPMVETMHVINTNIINTNIINTIYQSGYKDMIDSVITNLYYCGIKHIPLSIVQEKIKKLRPKHIIEFIAKYEGIDFSAITNYGAYAKKLLWSAIIDADILTSRYSEQYG